jgi:hypothetical protein
MYAAVMGSGGMIYIRSFIKIGIPATSGLCLSNLKVCNIGFTNQRDL